MNVIEMLRDRSGFTATDEALADYILLHVDDVCEMTIGSLAEASHSSSASIVRLCRKLGLDGYRDLRIELARELERERTRMLEVNPDRPFLEGSATADIASSILALQKQALDATYASLSMGAVQRAARLLLGSRRIVYYAIGDSCASAEMFSQLLYKIGLTCTSGMPRGDYGVLERTLDARDVALIITYSGRLVQDNEQTFAVLRANACKVILITADASLAERMLGCDCLLQLPKGETVNGRLATFFSQECIRYALNCIYGQAYAADYERNMERWQMAQRMMGGLEA